MKFDIVGVNDCYDVWTVDPTGWTWALEPGKTVDEFACVWGRTEVANTGHVIEHPLRDLSRLKDYRWPDPDDPRRYEGFVERLQAANDKFVMFCFGHGIWERFHMLTGLAEALVALVRHKDVVHELVERVLDFHLRVLRNVQRLAGGRIDAAAIGDDWGLQDRAFMSVPMFREFFRARYQRWFDEIKALGMHTWMHSCGRINTILPELIDCGLEVINSQQPNTVGLREFGAQFRGKICFEAIVDTQSTLPRGTHEEIRQQAREIRQFYGTPAGGLIPSDYNDAAAIGVTTDRRLVMFEAFAEQGGYPGYEALLARARSGHAATTGGYGRHTAG